MCECCISRWHFSFQLTILCEAKLSFATVAAIALIATGRIVVGLVDRTVDRMDATHEVRLIRNRRAQAGGVVKSETVQDKL